MVWGLVLSAAVLADEPSAQPPSPPPGTPATAASGGAPDDELIEFLGADDVGDAAWWEFLKKSTSRKGQLPATPPQDAHP